MVLHKYITVLNKMSFICESMLFSRETTFLNVKESLSISLSIEIKYTSYENEA